MLVDDTYRKKKMSKKPNIEVDDLFKHLINKYGSLQLIVAIEELSELQKELCKSFRNKDNKEAIIEEYVDCYIMLQQVKMYFDIKEHEILEIYSKKIERQIEREGLNGTNKRV